MVNNPIQHAKTDIKCVPFYQYYQILTNPMLSKLKNAVFIGLLGPKGLLVSQGSLVSIQSRDSLGSVFSLVSLFHK